MRACNECIKVNDFLIESFAPRFTACEVEGCSYHGHLLKVFENE